MAIARVGTGSGKKNGASVASVGTAYAPGGTGRLLTISGCVFNSTVTVPTVADNTAGAAGTWVVKNQTAATGTLNVFHAYLENSGSGITTITVTGGAGGAFYAFAIDEWTGVATSASFDQWVHANSDPTAVTSIASGTLTPSGAGALVLGAGGGIWSTASNPWTTTLGAWTQIISEPDSNAFIGEQSAFQLASAGVSITWINTSSNVQMGTNLVSFLAAGGGGGGGGSGASQRNQRARARR